MFLVCVDCSKNNLLTEQLSVRSFYDLPVLNSVLPELQLKNFADLQVDKCYIINSEKTVNFALFETVCISESDFNKEMMYILRAKSPSVKAIIPKTASGL